MKIDNLKIKDDITPDVVAEAIEFVANSCFVNGNFNPYYQSFAERMAVVKFFLDGIEFEENDSLFVIGELDDVKKLVNKFFADPKYSDSAKIMSVVRSNAEQIIEFRKQRIIHGADAIEYIASAVGEFKGYIEDFDVALSNLAKIKLQDITKEDIENARELIAKLNASGIELNTETVTKIIKDASRFDIDKATQEIIDTKNKEIEELKKKLASVTIKESNG